RRAVLALEHRNDLGGLAALPGPGALRRFRGLLGLGRLGGLLGWGGLLPRLALGRRNTARLFGSFGLRGGFRLRGFGGGGGLRLQGGGCFAFARFHGFLSSCGDYRGPHMNRSDRTLKQVDSVAWRWKADEAFICSYLAAFGI